MIFSMYECEERIGYTFKDKTLLRKCFTHSSYSHEHGTKDNNERLEFFGDSILGFITSEYLMKKYPEASEGMLTEYKQQLVSKIPLSQAIAKSGLDEFILYGEGEKKNSPEHHENANENLFEAIVAGIYIDGGLNEATKFIQRNLFQKIRLNNEVKNTSDKVKSIDGKSKLQEYVQKYKLGKIEYCEKERSGPPHDPIFTMVVMINGKEYAKASGKRKTEAEKICAIKTLEMLSKVKRGNSRGNTKRKRTEK